MMKTQHKAYGGIGEGSNSYGTREADLVDAEPPEPEKNTTCKLKACRFTLRLASKPTFDRLGTLALVGVTLVSLPVIQTVLYPCTARSPEVFWTA